MEGKYFNNGYCLLFCQMDLPAWPHNPQDFLGMGQMGKQERAHHMRVASKCI